MQTLSHVFQWERITKESSNLKNILRSKSSIVYQRRIGKCERSDVLRDHEKRTPYQCQHCKEVLDFEWRW